MSAVDQELLTRLLDQHGPALVLYAQQWCSVPEDVVQEAFLQLMRERPAPTNAVGWLYRVVRNGAIDLSRAATRRNHHEATAASEREGWFAATSENQVDGSAAVRALESLPIEQREVIVLRLWGGQSFQQIAELIGRSTSTAHRRYEIGVAKLRDELNITCPDVGSDHHARR